jgi:hypothetical protein
MRTRACGAILELAESVAAEVKAAQLAALGLESPPSSEMLLLLLLLLLMLLTLLLMLLLKRRLPSLLRAAAELSSARGGEPLACGKS